IFTLVIGITLIVLGILFVFIMPDIGETIKNSAIGIMILLLVTLMLYPELKKPKSKLVFTLMVVELAITLLVSIMFMANVGGAPSLWFGLVIYTHGVIQIIGGYFSQKSQNILWFILYILFITVGVYVFAANLITNDMLLNLLLVMFVLPGVIFLVIGLLGLKNKPKKVVAEPAE
ncbi:MAG: hypothetical protein Q7I99_02705, partial [Acholeplasmataceae bacterium]|nr:hypothetical protein [Acholeplasmataceae bacterium]